MKNTKRALRRYHRQRMIRRASQSLVLSAWDENPEWKRWQVLRWADNLKKCACWMCGNPRRTRKELDVQELRINEAARYELREHEEAQPGSQTGRARS